MDFKDYFRWRSNVNNDDGIFLETRSENGCGKWHFWSEIGPGFGEPSGTPPPRIPRSTPRANVAGIFRITINTWVLRQWANRASPYWELKQIRFCATHATRKWGQFYLFICLDANNFVLLSVFILIKSNLPKRLNQTTAQWCKKSTSGWLPSVKNAVAKLPIFYEGNNGATGFLRLPIKL